MLFRKNVVNLIGNELASKAHKDMRHSSHLMPAHPGEVLLDNVLRPLKITQRLLAAHLGWSVSRLNGLIKGHYRMSCEAALQLAETFNLDPKELLDLQRDWDLWHALRRHKKIGAMIEKEC